MQITIDTHAEPLLPIIRMLQALHEAQNVKLRVTHESTGQTVAELTASSIEFSDAPIEDDARKATIAGVKPEEIYTGEALKAALRTAGCAPGGVEGPDHAADANSYGLHCTGHVDYAPETRIEPPTPEQVFAAPKSLFDSHVPGDNITVREAREAHSDVTVDKSGLPWDARIHSGAKTKLANGNWKLLRGVDPELVKTVEAELRGAPTTPAAAQVAEPASVPPPPAPVAPPVGVPSPPAPLPIPPAPKPITNAAELVAAVMDKRFTTDQVNAACRAVGVENVASLLAKQDKLPEVLRHLGVPT